jgi:hypothetical protein
MSDHIKGTGISALNLALIVSYFGLVPLASAAYTWTVQRRVADAEQQLTNAQKSLTQAQELLAVSESRQAAGNSRIAALESRFRESTDAPRSTQIVFDASETVVSAIERAIPTLSASIDVADAPNVRAISGDTGAFNGSAKLTIKNTSSIPIECGVFRFMKLRLKEDVSNENRDLFPDPIQLDLQTLAPSEERVYTVKYDLEYNSEKFEIKVEKAYLQLTGRCSATDVRKQQIIEMAAVAGLEISAGSLSRTVTIWSQRLTE